MGKRKNIVRKLPVQISHCTEQTRTFAQNPKVVATSIQKKENERIEFRVSKEDKSLFEYATEISGFKSLSEFVRRAILKEAKAIIAEKERILVSQRDKDIFFGALMGDEEKPNEALISALRNHREMTSD